MKNWTPPSAKTRVRKVVSAGRSAPSSSHSLTVEEAVAAAMRGVRASASPVREAFPVERIEGTLRIWRDYAQSRGFSPRYITTFLDVMGKLLWWLQREGETDLSTESLRRFMVYLQTAHTLPEGRWGEAGLTEADHQGKAGCAAWRRYKALSTTSLKDYHKHVTTFSNWLKEEQMLDRSPAERLQEPIHRDSGITFDVFTPDEVRLVFKAAAESRYPVRNLAICFFLLETGVRASELVGLLWSDVDIEGRKAVIRPENAKGGKERVVHWESDTAKALWAWVQDGGIVQSGPVFRAMSGGNIGGPMTRHGLGKCLRLIGEKAGVPHCHPHTFRHTYATFYLLAGGNQMTLMDLMGHENLEMTKRYVRFTGIDLAKQARQFSPVAYLKRQK